MARAPVIVVCLLLAAAPAAAQGPTPVERAMSYATTAEDLAKEGDLDGAIRLFRKAWDLTHEPVLLYNLGRMHDKKGDLANARDLYEQYLREEKDADGIAAGRKKLDAVLDRIPGALRIETDPPGAEISVNGKPAGSSPITIEGLKRGAHTVAARLAGHDPALATLSVVPGTVESGRLALGPSMVELTVACACKGSRVDLDGRTLGIGPLEKAERVKPGRHTVAVVPEFGDGVVRGVDVPIGRPSRVEVRLDPWDPLLSAAEAAADKGELAAAQRLAARAMEHKPDTRGIARVEALRDRIPGRLAVATVPEGGEVEIDGKPAGRSPIGPVTLTRGEHEVRARMDGHKPFRTLVMVEAGKEARVTAALSPLPQPPPSPRPAAGEVARVARRPAEPPPVAPPPAAPPPARVASLPARVAPLPGPVAPPPGPVAPAPIATSAPRPFFWHWVALSAGVATIVAGGVLTALAAKDEASVSEAGRWENGTVRYDSLTRAEAIAAQDRANAKATASYALYGIGAGAVVTGVVLWVTLGRGKAAASGDAPAISVLPSPNGATIGATGRF